MEIDADMNMFSGSELSASDSTTRAVPDMQTSSSSTSSSNRSYAASPPPTSRSSSSSSVASLPGLDSDSFELSASSPSASPPSSDVGQRLVWVGMSSAARNPVAARRKAELKERKERQKAQQAEEHLAARTKVKRAAVNTAIKPQRMSARVVALQQAKAERDRARKARGQKSEDDERDEEHDTDRDEEDEEKHQKRKDDDGDDYSDSGSWRSNNKHRTPSANSSSTTSHSHSHHDQRYSKKRGRASVSTNGTSSSSSTSHSNATAVTIAPPTHSFLETIASLSRVGFEPWRLVPSQSIPHMTYEGYVALAFDSLEPSSRRAIARALPYIAEHGDEYHSTPWPLIWGHTPSPLQLYRRVDRVYGKEEHRVVASRRIEEKEVVGFLAGRLTEQSKAQKEGREDEHHHFFMERSYLHTFFEYEGEHSLMISTKEHRSIVSYIRDPCEKTDGEDANIKVDVVLDTVTHLFFVVLYAATSIGKGEELYCLPFLGKFLSRAHRQMFLYARISHYYHRYATLLERTLLSHPDIVWDRQVPARIEARPLTAEQESLHYGDEEERSRVYQIPLDEGYLQWDVANALMVSKCRYEKIAYLGGGCSDEVRQRMTEISDHLPDTVTIEGNKVKVDRTSLLTIVTCGHDSEMIEVREDRCIGSPVRYFDVPSRPSFCVMARRPIAPGTFVFTYAGEVSEQVINYSSTYVYNLCAADIRRAVPGYTHLPNLYLDAMATGNIARFVNDNRYRLTEDGAPGSSANLDCTFLFHGGMLHLAFYAVRTIEGGEELISQYGDDYWKTINSRLIDDHKEYYEYVSCYIQHMQHTLHTHNVPLPPKPDYRVETYRLFEHKPEPYPDVSRLSAGGGVGGDGSGSGSGGSADGSGGAGGREIDDPRYEVGAVLDHHPTHAMSHSTVTHYLVQWVGYDGNTWEQKENMDGCEKLIETYFELRKMEKRRSGALKSVNRGAGGGSARGKKKKTGR